MEGLFTPQPFTGFGPSRLADSASQSTLCRIRGRRASALRQQVREQAPRRPGIYGMLDANGLLIYVGKAKLLRTRLLSYFRVHSRDPKAGRILHHTRLLVWEECPSEFAALVRELEVIRHWRPRYNVQGQPNRRRRSYVCLGRKPAPYVFLHKTPPSDILGCYGPVLNTRKTREAVRRLNDWYRLRDCTQAQTMIFADQTELFAVPRTAGCLRYEIGTCLGPCLGACSRSAYAGNVRATRAFLEGKHSAPLQALEQAMTEAASAQSFERAAGLRDKLQALRWLNQQLEYVRTARRDSLVYPVTGWDGSESWHLIHHGQLARVVRAPQDKTEANSVRQQLEAIFGKPPGVVEEVESLLLVAAWFRRRPEERARAWTHEEALARLSPF